MLRLFRRQGGEEDGIAPRDPYAADKRARYFLPYRSLQRRRSCPSSAESNPPPAPSHAAPTYSSFNIPATPPAFLTGRKNFITMSAADYQALLDLDENNEVPSTVGASEGEIRRNPSFVIR